MVFSSFDFLLLFLPFFLAIFYLVPNKLKNLILLVFSIVFFAYGSLQNPIHIFLILYSLLFNYIAGMIIEKTKLCRKFFFTISVIANFGVLFVYKYLDFFIGCINDVLKISMPQCDHSIALFELAMPIGLSFYTFQIVSYLSDVYRGVIKSEKNPIDFGAYNLMFPKFISGPIVRYGDVRPSLKSHKISGEKITEGVNLLIIGMGLKVILANQIGNLWYDINTVGYVSISTPLAWMGIIAYSLQLYFDFYGYSLMAIGLGKMIGVDIPVNFNHPYISRSMTEFWRRWHITLGSWFRDYVYIPMGGNRKGKIKTIYNLLIVWLLTGFWHGAGWNFLLWGFVLFIFIALEKTIFGRLLKKCRILSHIYMIFLIPLSWLIFAIGDLKKLSIYFHRLFGYGGNNLFPDDYIKYGKSYGILLIVGLIFCTPLPSKIYAKIKNKLIFVPILLAIFSVSVYCLYKGLNDPFMYFRF